MTQDDLDLLWNGQATQMSAAGKIEYVLTSILPMLQNDMRVVVESGCNKHGCGSGPNFSIALLCMIACETVGALAAPAGVRGPEATRAFIDTIALLSKDIRYQRFSRLLTALFRNGIAHSFLPKQGSHLAAKTVWIPGCIDDLAVPGNLQVDLHRMRTHLEVSDDGSRRTFQVVTKILYLDVRKAIDEFAARLQSATAATSAEFVVAFDDWVRANEEVKGRKHLTDVERRLLEGT